MSVRKVGERWLVDIRYKSERFRVRSPGTSKADAHAHEVYLRGELAAHGNLDHLALEARPQIPTLATFVERWLIEYVDVNNGVWERHTKRCILARSIVPFFGVLRLNAIAVGDVQRFKAECQRRQLSAKTINNHLTVLRRLLGTAAEWGSIESVPTVSFLKTSRPSIDYLREDELAKLLNAAEPLLASMVRCAVDTGLRFGELSALRWGDINLACGIITVQRAFALNTLKSPKSGRVRYIPLPRDLLTHLRTRAQTDAMAPNDGWIFSFRGRPVCHATARWWLHALCRRVGLRRVGWHCFRHTYASRLVSRAAPMRAVQELLGHQSMNMTLRYAHLAPDALRDAVSVLDSGPEIVGTPWAQRSEDAPRIRKDRSVERLSMVAPRGVEPLLMA